MPRRCRTPRSWCASRKTRSSWAAASSRRDNPTGLLRPFFLLWFDVLVPLAGRILPGGEAYTYLPASVRRFPGPEDLAAALERSGFTAIRFRLLAGGIVALHVGEAA